MGKRNKTGFSYFLTAYDIRRYSSLSFERQFYGDEDYESKKKGWDAAIDFCATFLEQKAKEA